MKICRSISAKHSTDVNKKENRVDDLIVTILNKSIDQYSIIEFFNK